jgi:DNA-binding transcriptional LysR family regulator
MSTIKQLEIFVKVIECDGVIRAANALHVTPPAVTKQIKTMEAHLGIALFNRIGRKLVLTEMGQLYYQEATQALHNLKQLEALIKTGKKEVSGILKVRSSQFFAHQRLLPQLPQFLERYPKLQLNLELQESAADFLTDKVDVLYGTSIPSQTHWEQKQIGVTRYVLCASPGYIKQAGIVHDIADLQNHRYLTHTGRNPDNLIRFKNQEIMVSPYLWFNSYDGLFGAALQDLGLIWVHYPAVEPLLQTGKLIELLPKEAPPAQPVYIQYLHGEYIDPKIRAFVDFFSNESTNGSLYQSKV